MFTSLVSFIIFASIGMGGPNMDFFVREVRECLKGDMIVIRSVHMVICDRWLCTDHIKGLDLAEPL